MVYERVSTLLASQFDVDEGDFSEETAFEELGADEVDLSELVRTLEGEFDIHIHPDEFAGLNTVGDLVGLIETAVGNP